jgi:hypothetical protein
MLISRWFLKAVERDETSESYCERETAEFASTKV